MSGVENRWQVHPQNTTLSEKLGHSLSVHPVIAQIMLNRGIRSLEDAKLFLDPNQAPKATFPTDWIQSLTAILKDAITSKKRILLYGDYDVDGMTSTAQFMRFLTFCGAKVSYKIPNRFVEGYGLSHHLVEAIKDRPLDLLITLDCGITNVKEISAIKALGTQVVVIDHHTIPTPPPPADCIINPKALEADHPLYHLCTAGIVYKLLEAMQAELAPEFPLEQELDVVALGTIADVAPLIGENRRLTRMGLNKLSQRKRPGIDELLIQANFKHAQVGTRDIGFSIAPRLNAAGRLKSAALGVELLLETDRQKATEMAIYLDKLNRERQQLGQDIQKQALEQLEKEDPTAPIVVLSAPGWHPGIIGITASRLVEHSKKPVVMITQQDSICRASARTIGSINLYDILKSGETFYSAFGGHKEAAGFSITEDKIPALKETLIQTAKERISEKDRCPIIEIDAKVTPNELNINLAENLHKMGPFGQKNPSPVLYTNQLTIIDSKLVGEKGTHLKLTLSDPHGTIIIDAIGFNLHHKLSVVKKKNPELIFSLEVNHWQGRKSPQLNLIDLQ